MTVADLRYELDKYPDDMQLSFSIDEDVCETLKDSYRYEPDISFYQYDYPEPYVVANIGAHYAR